MKIGFFGTPEHSAKLLKELINSGYEIQYVVTNPDKPRGRDRNLEPTPVKKIAIENGIKVYQFPGLKDENSIHSINEHRVDLNIVFAYGQIIPRKIFDNPPGKTINLHGSILPEFRGASPIQAAILNGKKETGITLQYITDELDAGNIISISKVSIEESDTFGSLLDKITDSGILEIKKILKSYTGSPFPSLPQDNSLASYCKKIKPEDRVLNFSRDDGQIHNQIRAFNPGNICFTFFREKRLNVHRTTITEIENLSPPGSLVLPDKKTLGVVCGNKKVLILEQVQLENKKIMTGADFINGSRILPGELLK